MADNEEPPAFLTMAFDWYILEKWQSSDPMDDGPQRKARLIELGRAYADLGHEGRRPYVIKAYKYGYEIESNSASPPANVDNVPHDLLTANERMISKPDQEPVPIWLRTDYGPGTDERFQQMLDKFPDAVEYYLPIANDPRYDGIDHPLQSAFAFFPCLLQSEHPDYLEEELSFDSAEVQNALFATDHAATKAEEDRMAQGQIHLFIADREAMRTGFVRWVAPDQYGRPLFDERIQPWSLRKAMNLRIKRSLQEFRNEIADGQYHNNTSWGNYASDPNLVNRVLGPWNPPA